MGRLRRFWLIFGLLMTAFEVSYAIAACDAVEGFDHRAAPLGEVSIRFAEILGGMNVNPRTGAGMPRGRFVYLVFPRTKSNPAWPASPEQLQKRTQEMRASIGGWERVRACITSP